MTKKTWIWSGVAAVAIAGVAAVLVPQFAKANKPKQELTPVPEFVPGELGKAQRVQMPQEVTATGVLAAQRNATLRAKVSAEVMDVRVREGDSVRIGEVLMRLDTLELQHKLASQEGGLASAQARLANARKTRDTQKALLDQQYISQNAYDSAQSAYDAAAGEVESARAQVALAREAVSDALVRSPVAGVVAKRYVQPGEKVAFDAPLMQIVDLDSLELQAWVPPQTVAQLKPGQSVAIRVDGLPKDMQARLRYVLPAADPATRQIGVVIDVPNPQRVLKVGMQANARIRLAEREVLAVPSVALRDSNGDYSLWVLREGHVKRVAVKLGQRDDARGLCEVLDPTASGLQLGDVVLAGRYDGLKDGQEVRVVQNKPQAPASAASAPKA